MYFSYPAPPDEANLIMINDMHKKLIYLLVYLIILGYVAPVIGVSLGAKIIEKHFIIDKSIGGPDASFSLDKNEFKQMVRGQFAKNPWVQ